MTSLRGVLIDVSVAAAIGLLLALLGPFGTFASPFPERLAYWLLLVVGGYFCFRPAMEGASWAADRLELPRAALWIAACLIAAVPMAVIVWMADGVFGPVHAPDVQTAALYYSNVLVVSAITTLVFWFVNERREARTPRNIPEPSPGQPAAPGSRPRLFDRLPPSAGRVLLALEMQDHYVLAHSDAGSEMFLMRMRDAIAELDGLDGARVHRSWWVARAAVRGVKREGRNIRLILDRGLEAPVARGAVAALQADGWLDR